MAFYIPRGLGSRFNAFFRSYCQDAGLRFRSALTQEQLQRAAAAEGVAFGGGDDCVFTPEITLWAFVGQCISSSKTCVSAVARVIVLLTALGRPPCSAATGAYCKARRKLPEGFLRRLTYQVGVDVEDQAPASWRWHNRRTILVDGGDTDADDTAANQREYPQPSSQRRGLGFPMIRFVLLLTFATGTTVGAATGPYSGKETGETALFRSLLDQLRAGDLVVADRYYCSYFMIALLQAKGVDVAFRLHQGRHYDFRRGYHLGPDDHNVHWVRPQRPDWMDEETYQSMPGILMVREVRVTVDKPGFRSRSIMVATTLRDDSQYSSADIADLYHQRWHAELDIRAIKRSLGLEMIHCKTPEMVRKSLWAHLLGYNLVRQAAAQAAWQHGLAPRQISFASTMHLLEAHHWLLLTADDLQGREAYHALLLAIATHIVGNRPDRIEPRRVKRRDDRYPPLNRPRAQARAEAMQGRE